MLHRGRDILSHGHKFTAEFDIKLTILSCRVSLRLTEAVIRYILSPGHKFTAGFYIEQKILSRRVSLRRTKAVTFCHVVTNLQLTLILNQKFGAADSAFRLYRFLY